MSIMSLDEEFRPAEAGNGLTGSAEMGFTDLDRMGSRRLMISCKCLNLKSLRITTLCSTLACCWLVWGSMSTGDPNKGQ